MKLSYSIVLLLLFIYSCDPIQKLTIENKTNEDIFLSISFDGNLDNYPIEFGPTGDTLWNRMEYAPSRENTILAAIGREGWKYAILRNSIDSSLTLFVYERSLLSTITPDSILPDHIYSRKTKYRLQDLESAAWVIQYK